MKKVLTGMSPGIERLLQHSRYLSYLSNRVLTYLPENFKDRINVLKFDQHVLVISATSSAWAAKLRFFIPNLKRFLKSDPQFCHIQTIRIKVAMANSNAKKQKNKPDYSLNAALVIRNSAQHISDDGLKASLLKLSEHISEKNT